MVTRKAAAKDLEIFRTFQKELIKTYTIYKDLHNLIKKEK